MAITFRGSIVTGPITALPSAVALSIECSLRSLVKVNVLRLIAEMDTMAAVTGANRTVALFKVRKFAGTTAGGVVVSQRGAFDTAQTADSGVIVRQTLGYAGDNVPAITYTGAPLTMSTSFGERVTTFYGQQLLDDLVLIRDNRPASTYLYLYPGECLIVTWNDDTYPVGGVAVFNLLWEEDSLGTEYTIGGQVTLAGSPVSGAKILVVTGTDRDLPDPQIEIVATNGSGNWTKTLAAAIEADAFVQHRSGETLYTSEGKPYLKKP